MFISENDPTFGEALGIYLHAKGDVESPLDVGDAQVVRVAAQPGSGNYDSSPASASIRYITRSGTVGWKFYEISDSVDEFMFDFIKVVFFGGK